MNTYWWIEKPNGKFVTFGRRISDIGEIHEGGMPRLQRTKREAKNLCWQDEKPVRVKLIKES